MPPPRHFTMDDGDVILRSGMFDFQVHKSVLSLASPFFKGMFEIPQPSSTSALPVIDISEPPDVIEFVLEYLYPVIDRQIIDSLSEIHNIFTVVDKYEIASLVPHLKERLRTFLNAYPFGVYVIGCQFKLLEEVRDAAEQSTPTDLHDAGFDDALKWISTEQFYRLMAFIEDRDKRAKSIVDRQLGDGLVKRSTCDHSGGVETFYSNLREAIVAGFAKDPCLSIDDLCFILDRIPDPPAGCLSPHSSDHYKRHNDEAFSCPLAPMSIRRHLKYLFDALEHDRETLAWKTFVQEE